MIDEIRNETDMVMRGKLVEDVVMKAWTMEVGGYQETGIPKLRFRTHRRSTTPKKHNTEEAQHRSKLMRRPQLGKSKIEKQSYKC